MSFPNKFKNRQMQDLRLGIKSSYNKIRNTIALLYCIYLASGKKAICDYGVANDNSQILASDLSSWIKVKFPSLDFDSCVTNSKLLTSQIEAIQVCLELVFGLAKISFNVPGSNLSERTGRNRYPKRITFSSNIRILDAIISSESEENQKSFLESWLNNSPAAQKSLQDKICQFLTLQTEKCVLKMRFKSKEDLFFQQEGIYEILSLGDEGVEVSDDEKVGTYRVLNSFINEGLHSYLKNSNGKIQIRDGVTREELKEYLTEVSTSLDLSEARLLTNEQTFTQSKHNLKDLLAESNQSSETDSSYLRAMRTKPFLLLAGISGTGKSRIVKQMAFDSCPEIDDLQNDKTSPGNYCLIEVKPNWHDSTELLGYKSQINGAHYEVTPFVKFLVKAMRYEQEKIPFFVCLDEMNLAPVEQYFAEFLSVLESRTKEENGHILSEPLIKADVFSYKDSSDKDENNNYTARLINDLFGPVNKEEMHETGSIRIISGKTEEEIARDKEIFNSLMEHGLRLPENLIVIGTVNMDETTHQFSRKVIDRAMTIEMNLPEGKDADGNDINPFLSFFDNASELRYHTNPNSASLYLASETKASDVVKKLQSENAEKTEWLKAETAAILAGINRQLDGTPFKVAYRVQNELLLYFHQLYLENPEGDWEEMLATSVDQILMMKVLPRVEGDEELLKKPLDRLITFCDPRYPNASKKLKEMRSRLENSQFTSFWP